MGRLLSLLAAAISCYAGWQLASFSHQLQLEGMQEALNAQRRLTTLQRESVRTAKEAARTAERGYQSCAEAVHILRARQQWLNRNLGLSERLEEGE